MPKYKAQEEIHPEFEHPETEIPKEKGGKKKYIAGALVLIIIAVMVGVSLFYSQGAFEMFRPPAPGPTTKTFTLDQSATGCENSRIKVSIINTGQEPLVLEDVSNADIDGEWRWVTPVSLGGSNLVEWSELVETELAPGESMLVVDTDCGGVCTPGQHVINLVIGTTVIHQNVYC